VGALAAPYGVGAIAPLAAARLTEVCDVAIDCGACTLDGLKFRTHAGMGRCQGGFCMSRCLGWLARRLGLPLPAFTKHGGDSWLVRSRTQNQVKQLP